MKLGIACMMLLGLHTAGWAADIPESFTCRLLSIADGDTLSVFCPQNLPPQQKIRLRIFGIDTPESRKQDAKCSKEIKLGLIAKAWAKKQFQTGDDVTWSWVSETDDDPRGRTIARVTLKSGKDWAEEAIRTGMATPYDPAAANSFQKKDWCKP